MSGLRASFTKKFPGGLEIAVENLQISGGVTVLFGPSGSGKTTILRCLAGLEKPDAGEISFGGETWFCKSGKRKAENENIFLPPEKRGIGFVPQDYALFPHLTVTENIGYGLHRISASEKKLRVAGALEWLGIAPLANRLPQKLSGGEAQRVALARAVVRKPKLLLLDEPLSALDAPTRQRLRGELHQQLFRVGIPTVLVTHERSEAIALGEKISVLNGGKILQHGSLAEIFNRPASLEAARIVGTETVFPGRVLGVQDDLVTVSVGDVRLVALAQGFPIDTKEVFVCIRAEDVLLAAGAIPTVSARNRIPATVTKVETLGKLVEVTLDCGFQLRALLTPQAVDELKVKPRALISAVIKVSHIHLLAG